MARINADNEFLCDPRLQILSQSMPRWEAIGSVICMWELGQSYWKKNRSLIPTRLFKLIHRGNDIIAAGLAEIREDGVYCKGANDRWVFLLSNSLAGKRGGVSRASSAERDAHGHFLPKHPDERPDDIQTAKHSSSSSSSSSIKNKELLLRSSSEESKKLQPANGGTAPKKLDPLVISSYYNAYSQKYGIKVRLTGKDVGILVRLSKSLGADRLSELLQVYLQMDTKWFETKHHDLPTFENSLAEIQVAHGTGKLTNERKKENEWDGFWKEVEKDEQASIRDEFTETSE